jgi:hypothetical protein
MRDGEESKVLKKQNTTQKQIPFYKGLKYKEEEEEEEEEEGLPRHPPTDYTTYWVVHFGGVWESLGF